MLKKITLSLAFILTLAIIAFAADKITGSYVGQLVGDDDILTYNLKADGETLTGKVTSVDRELPIYDGKIAGSTLTFKVNLNGVIIPHEAKISNDTLKVKLTYDGNVMEGTFVRKPNMVDNPSTTKKTF
jgi:hypothetical protein